VVWAPSAGRFCMGSPPRAVMSTTRRPPRAGRLEETRHATKGILRPEEGLRRFTLAREAPPADLAPFVDWCWTVRWDLAPGQSHTQQTLPAPCAHLALEGGAYTVHGPGTRRFVAELTGRSWVIGVRFRPAGLAAFTAVRPRALVDRVVPGEDVLGPLPLPADEPESEPLWGALRAREPRDTDALRVANRVVEAAAADPAAASVGALARLAGCSERSLHRLLDRYVGVGTKWIVRRARVQAAAERVARGEAVDWAGLARELGYADQAHLIRDFRAQIGETPAAYARRCR
jgi:AraC-like DNA-binding protein